jgi:hypothetical protein
VFAPTTPPVSRTAPPDDGTVPATTAPAATAPAQTVTTEPGPQENVFGIVPPRNVEC